MTRIKNISSRFIVSVCTRLAENKRVRRGLPQWGRLHIDRQLPFLCIYRKPDDRNDPGTDRLLTGQASYLLASGNRNQHKELSALVFHVVQTLVKEFGAFLILEIWSNAVDPEDDFPASFIQRPGFRIFASKSKSSGPTVKKLEEHLKKIRIRKLPAEVEVVYKDQYTAPHSKPLLSKKSLKDLQCIVIGLEIRSIYWNAATNEMYPLIRRTLRQKLTYVLQRTFYTFALNQTTHQPPNFHSLGRRAMVKAVWETDRQLTEITNSYDFLLQTTPLNADKAWSDFKRHKFQRAPVFLYRPLAVAPATLKRKLWDIKIDRVEDPTIADLFRQKRSLLDIQISMLENIETSKFLYGSLQLYGKIPEDLYDLACTIMERIPYRFRTKTSDIILDGKEFARYAREEIAYYHGIDPKFLPTVEIRDDITGLMVSHGNLLISNKIKISRSHVHALLQHEVGTHMLTYYNATAQPFKQLKSGLAGYEDLQEGLAVLAEFLVGGLSHKRLRILAGRVLASDILVNGASFIDTFRVLNRDYGFDQRTAYTITLRVHRGGGLIKDMVYLKGLANLLDYLKNRSDFDTLFVGKIGLKHIPVVRELQYRRILKSPPLRPRYLSLPYTLERLEIVRKGISILELIERSLV